MITLTAVIIAIIILLFVIVVLPKVFEDEWPVSNTLIAGAILILLALILAMITK